MEAQGQRDFEERTRALTQAARNTPGVVGLMFLGSAAVPARRDAWSDHDFFIIAEPGRAEQVREVEKWLPDPDRVVVLAREYGNGFSVLYDDCHLFEFAAASVDELADALIDEHEIVFDDGSLAGLVEAFQRKTAAKPAPDPANDVQLMLVKILVGVGRGRRGEVVNAGQFIRTWAVNHFLAALKARHPAANPVSDPFDLTRRLERDYPEWSRELTSALDQPFEAAGRDLLRLARRALEPGWSQFPSRAADAIEQRLGW